MKKRFQKIVAAVLTAALTVSALSGCGGSNNTAKSNGGNSSEAATNSTEQSSVQKTNLTVAVGSDFGDLGPFSTSRSAAYIANQVYESLIAIGYGMEMKPSLAKSWDKVDSTHYTLAIQEGVKDSAGNTFTAKDALFSLKRCSEAAESAAYVEDIDFGKTTTSDDYTLEVYFLQPNMYSLVKMANVRMFTQAAWEASKDQMVTDPVGTGAYVLKEYVSGSYIELTARDDYWGGKPELESAKFTVISEPSQATTALETGEVDLVMGMQASDVDYINSKDGFTVLQDAGTQCMSMFMNTSDGSVFSDKKVRQALCYAVDNTAIAKVVYGGFAFPCVCPFTTAMADYTLNCDGEMYAAADMEKAAALLQEAGVTSGTVRIATDGTSQENAIAEIIQNNLSELGFTAEINNYDSATIWSVAADATQWDIVLNVSSSPSGYGMAMLYAFLNNLNWPQWSGAELDKFKGLYQEAIVADSTEEYQSKVEEAVQIVEEEAPMYSFAELTNLYGYKDNLNFQVWNQDSLMVKDLKFK